MIPDRNFIQKELAECGLCPYIYVYDEVDSTNTRARELLDSESPDIIVLAASQTRGKGSHGRSFFSPADTGLYLTASFSHLPQTFPVTFAAAAASVSALRQFGTESSVKWVNDIMIKNRKAGGILCEKLASGKVIIGVGINISEPEGGFPEDLSDIAVSLGNSGVARDVLAVRLYSELYSRMSLDREKVMEEYRSVCGTLGRRITFDTVSGVRKGTAEAVRDDGALIVLTENGDRISFESGNVSIRYLDA